MDSYSEEATKLENAALKRELSDLKRERDKYKTLFRHLGWRTFNHRFSHWKVHRMQYLRTRNDTTFKASKTF